MFDPRVKILVIDPPTHFNDRKSVRRDNPERAPKFGTGVSTRYVNTMTCTELGGLRSLIDQILHETAYVFCWSTGVHLPEAFALLDFWGLEYKTMAFIWVKTNKLADTEFYGPGAYTWQNVEYCLLARPRNCGPLWHSNGPGCAKPHQVIWDREPYVIRCPHPRDEHGKIIHSRKPSEFFEKIESWLWPHMDRTKFDSVELFATEERLGWFCAGHSISGNLLEVDVPLYPAKIRRKFSPLEIVPMRAG